jgi:hypothetical protein
VLTVVADDGSMRDGVSLLDADDDVYVWADGVHPRIRLGENKACVLVLIGVRADGTKELIAMDEGYHESGESWTALLRAGARRGLRAPVFAVGDGALGEDVLPAFHDDPAAHQIHPRTTNPIESSFATVRVRTEATCGAGSRAVAPAMIVKPTEPAPSRRRAANAPHLVALVHSRGRFEHGIRLERDRAAA